MLHQIPEEGLPLTEIGGVRIAVQPELPLLEIGGQAAPRRAAAGQGGLIQVGPNPVGWANYLYVFSKDLPKYFGNTIILWLMGFIPQIFFSLLLAAWFTDNRLKLKCQGFFKTVIYMPNLIMASAFSMLIFVLFADQGPVNSMIQSLGGEPIRFLSNIWGTRSLVALMNFLMWFGNTTIILMAAMMGISPAMFEAAQIDGAGTFRCFIHVVLPVCQPILGAAVALSFADCWNLVEQPLTYLTTHTELYPLSVVFNQLTQQSTGVEFAGAALYTLPALLIYLYFQNDILEGVQLTELK